MRIARIREEPIAELRYLNAARRGGTTVERLPILVAELAAPLSGELDAIVASSDLQGIVRGRANAATLLGVAIAELLEELAFDGILPPVARTGAILAGDLYSVPAADKRGGYGDVADVWAAFAERYPWVAGVSGNHDDTAQVGAIERAHLLDGSVVALDDVRIGGVGGIVGNPEKKLRRDEASFLRLVDRVIDRGVDILVLHEGPHGDLARHQRGNAAIRDTIEAGEVALTICGHDHWDEPLAATPTGQVLNVDARVVVLLSSAHG